jgi:hypothetical protein
MVLEEYMKITTNEGEFELVDVSRDLGNGDYSEGQFYALKPTTQTLLKQVAPVKKTEKKEFNIRGTLIDTYTGLTLFNKDLVVTEPTANKLSKAISALVEYVQGEPNIMDVNNKAEAARKSYQESQ